MTVLSNQIIASFWNGNQRVTAEVESVRYEPNGSAHFTFDVGGEKIEKSSTAVTIEKVTRAHLLPEACFVCGHGPHDAGEHTYWSNADAAAEVAAEEARRQPPVYSSGARSPEAAYVAQHRPY